MMPDDSSSTFYIEQKTGKNARQVTSELAFPSSMPAVCQLVINGYDADASLVDVVLNTRQDSLTISDNGQGMDVDGLVSFFRLFESDKLMDPVSKGGRQVLGKKGIAKGAIRFLSFAYQLETTRGGNTLTVREFFAREMVKYALESAISGRAEPSYRDQQETLEQVLSGKAPQVIRDSEIFSAIEKRFGPLEALANKGELGNIAVDPKPANARLHGTKIIMGPLTSGRNILPLDIENLEAYLRNNIGPLLSANFIVKINGNTLSPVLPENAYSYEYEETLRKSGNVSCRIYYILDQDKSNSLHGINLYVDKFRVGMFPGLNLEKKRYSLANRIWVQVHVNSLRDKIQLDHLSVAEDHPKILEVREWLGNKIKEVVQDISAMARVDKRRKVQSIMSSVSRRLTKISGKPIVLKLGSDEEAGTIARYDNGRGIVYINQEFKVRDETSIGNRLNQQLFDISLLALTIPRSLAGVSGSATIEAKLFKSYGKLCSQGVPKTRTLGSLVPQTEDKGIMRDPLQMGINPSRLYRPAELVEISGREPIVFCRAVTSGLLPAGPVIKGDAAIAFLKQLHGGYTVEEIVRRFTDTPQALFYSVAEKLKRNLAQKGLPKYAKDISSNSVPFIRIQAGSQQKCIDDYFSIRGQWTKMKPGEELIKVGDAIIYLRKETGLARMSPAVLTRMERDELIPAKKWRSGTNNGYKRQAIEALAVRLKVEDALIIKYGL